jgi:uncharacterized protein YdbL (DUF1318 family)
MSGGFNRLARRLSACATALVVALGVMTGAAFADALSDARQAGYVGERPDGYVALVDPGAPASVRALVDEINAQRRAAYQNISNQTGVPVDQVGIRAAQRLYSELPPGTPVLLQNGQWARK